MTDHFPPKFQQSEFNCPHCGVFAHQHWSALDYAIGSQRCISTHYKVSYCWRCSELSIWYGTKLVYPVESVAPRPNADLPDDIKFDYQEAAQLLPFSPRAAAALLRLCVQKLCRHLGEAGRNINDDIASLVRKGLPTQLQQALDIVRVIGNNAVHPGQIAVHEEPETATEMFGIVNMIAEKMISEPKQIAEMYGRLPERDRNNIERRDNPPNGR
jgi:hypothetical protein